MRHPTDDVVLKIVQGAGTPQAAPEPGPYSDPATSDLIRYWEGAEAGWYPDPDSSDVIRYWDGSRWTDLATPTPPPLASLGHSLPSLPPPLPDELSKPKASLRTWWLHA